LTMLDRGEARALSFSKECESLWLYLPIYNHHASIPAQGIAYSKVKVVPGVRRRSRKRRRGGGGNLMQGNCRMTVDSGRYVPHA